MTRLEQIEFDNKEKFLLAIEKLLNSEEVFRSYKTKDGETKQKKIISKGNLYLGNNFGISFQEGKNNKIYVSVNYFSIDNRFEINSKKSNEL